ncbi:15157_t:CDS:2, partial [Cetraspora pellucida]
KMDNAALLLQLLTNPSALQQVLTTIIQNQKSSSMPESTLLASSNAIIRIFPRGSAQNPITKEEWRQWKKNKEGKNWKDFLNLLYDTYWSYRRNLCDRLNACCQKGKYTSEQNQGIVQKVIEK